MSSSLQVAFLLCCIAFRFNQFVDLCVHELPASCEIESIFAMQHPIAVPQIQRTKTKQESITTIVITTIQTFTTTMTSSSTTSNHKNADNKNGGESQQQQQYRRYTPPTDMNQHLTQILQQMNSSDIPIAIKGYNSFIETLKNETYTAQKQFVQSCQSKSQQYNLAHLAKKVQQQQQQQNQSSSSSYEKNQGLIPLDNLSHFYMYEHSHHEHNSSTSSSSITVYRSADFLPAFGGVNHDSILVQYILKSPQMHELKKLHEIFLKV